MLLHNWDINDHDVVDKRERCLQHLWHIDNFVNGLNLSQHWDIDNLVNEMDLRDFNSFLHLLMTRTWLRTTTGTSAICFTLKRSLPRHSKPERSHRDQRGGDGVTHRLVDGAVDLVRRQRCTFSRTSSCHDNLQKTVAPRRQGSWDPSPRLQVALRVPPFAGRFLGRRPFVRSTIARCRRSH